MKKIIFSAGLLFSLLFISSCDDKLNKEPYDSVSEEKLFSSSKGFTNAILATYKQFIYDENARQSVYYGGPMFSLPDVLTDNVILNDTGRQSLRTVFDWLYTPNNTSNNIYINAYKVIHNANVILSNTSKLDDIDFKNNIEGEALTARALAHFDLARIYAKIPTQDPSANDSPGIAYVTKVDNSQKPSRDQVKVVYENIIDDLLQAKDKINKENPDGRFNLNTVNALLSRVYLYMGKWKEAAAAAADVIGSVCSITDFPKLWTDESKSGIISEFLVRQIDPIAIGVQYSQTSPKNGVRSEYNISYELYQLYNSNDVRKSAYVSTSIFGDNNYNHIAKYFGKKGQVNGKVNAKIIRMAEVMLNKAEALAEDDKDVEALAALDQVRSNRYTGFTSPNETGPALKEAIALERRLEFAFETHRFFDLKRKGLAIQRSTTEGDLANGTGIPASFTNMPAGDYKFQYAIPEQATQANPNLKQNPGY